jgi:hypothetical protein
LANPIRHPEAAVLHFAPYQEPDDDATFISNERARVGRTAMIRKLPSGKYRLYSRKKNPKTGRRRNLGTFDSRAAAERHERAVQYFKRH